MFGQSPTDVIPGMRQAIGTKQIMTTILFLGRKRIVPAILPKGIKFNHYYFVDYFSRFENRKREFSSSDPAGGFWVHTDNSICHNESKVASKFEKHHASRLPHPLYSPV
jgi:hypothetical protein